MAAGSPCSSAKPAPASPASARMRRGRSIWWIWAAPCTGSSRGSKSGFYEYNTVATIQRGRRALPARHPAPAFVSLTQGQESMPQHFIKVRDVSADAFNHMIDKSIEIKRDPAPWHDSMRNQTLAMIFQKTSTRTRFSFEAGMTELGGHAIFAQTQHTQMGIADIAD